VHQRLGRGDRAQPQPERRFRAVLVQPAERLHEGVLHDVLGRVGVPDHAPRETEHRVLEGLVQAPLRDAIAPAGTRKDLISHGNVEGAGHDL
jgi:hypothetical protein